MNLIILFIMLFLVIKHYQFDVLIDLIDWLSNITRICILFSKTPNQVVFYF